MNILKMKPIEDFIEKKQGGVIIQLSSDHWEHLAGECKLIIELLCKSGMTLFDVSQSLHVITLLSSMPTILENVGNGDKVHLSNKFKDRIKS